MTTDTTVHTDNKLIAEFMGYVLKPCNNGQAWECPSPHRQEDDPSYLHGRLWRENDTFYKYHSSWDWLMPVITKIEDMGYEVLIGRISCNIHEIGNEANAITDRVCGDIYKKLEITYICVVEFIKWYNKENK